MSLHSCHPGLFFLLWIVDPKTAKWLLPRKEKKSRVLREKKLTLSDVGVLVTITELEGLVDTGGGTGGDIGAEDACIIERVIDRSEKS